MTDRVNGIHVGFTTPPNEAEQVTEARHDDVTGPPLDEIDDAEKRALVEVDVSEGEPAKTRTVKTGEKR